MRSGEIRSAMKHSNKYTCRLAEYKSLTVQTSSVSMTCRVFQHYAAFEPSPQIFRQPSARKAVDKYLSVATQTLHALIQAGIPPHGGCGHFGKASPWESALTSKMPWGLENWAPAQRSDNEARAALCVSRGAALRRRTRVGHGWPRFATRPLEARGSRTRTDLDDLGRSSGNGTPVPPPRSGLPCRP